LRCAHAASRALETRQTKMGLMFMLTVAVIIAAVGALPIWHHSKNWGYYPIGGVSVIILIILFFLLRGRL
jgi:low affinity Fe/Cu permease